VGAIGFLAVMVFPGLKTVVMAAAAPPGFIFEVGLGLGCWLREYKHRSSSNDGCWACS